MQKPNSEDKEHASRNFYSHGLDAGSFRSPPRPLDSNDSSFMPQFDPFEWMDECFLNEIDSCLASICEDSVNQRFLLAEREFPHLMCSERMGHATEVKNNEGLQDQE